MCALGVFLSHFTVASTKCRLTSWRAFGYSAPAEVKGFKNRASISVMIQCPAPELVQGKQGSIPIKKEPTVCLHLLSSAQWLMKDQKPQRRAAPHSCILFPLNINTPVRQMRLQPPLNFAPQPPPNHIQEVSDSVFSTNYLLESKNLFTESLLINGQGRLLIMKYHYLGKQALKAPVRRFLGATIYIFSGFFYSWLFLHIVTIQTAPSSMWVQQREVKCSSLS